MAKIDRYMRGIYQLISEFVIINLSLQFFSGTMNSTTMPEVDNSTDYEEGIDLTAFFELPEIDTTEVKKVLSAIDSLTVIYFTIEYIVRFCCSPNKGKFFIKPMNLVDFLSILPYVLTFFLNSLQDLHILSKAGKVSSHRFFYKLSILID